MWSYFPFHGNSIVLSPSGNYLYFSNAVSVMVFRRMAPILGLQYVNLYNGIHSIGFDKSNTKYYWRCDYDTARQAYIGAFDTDGLWLIDVSDPTQFQVTTQQYKPPGQSATIDVFYTKNNYQIMMVAINYGVNFMAVLDVSNYASITIIQKVPLGFPFPGYIKDVDNNQSDTLLVCSLDKMIAFVDTTTLGSYFVVATWNFLPFMKGFTTGVMLSTDEKYFIGACRGYGYYVLDVSNLQNIQYINFFDSTGAEQVYKSLLYMYYYLVDGLGGLYIMDQKKLPSFVSFSQLTVAGWTNDVTYLKDEKTVIISTLQQGMIYLLDISDVTNPFIVSSFQNGNQNGLFTCVKQDFTTVFINNNVQTRAFPMTVSAYLHADYLQVLGYTPDGDMEFSIINVPDQFNFQVGQTIKINTSYLYQSLDLQVASVTQYQNQIGQALPYWVSYNPVEISLTITIQKEAVDPTNLSKPLLNTFVFTSLLPLYASNFLYTIGSYQTSNSHHEQIILTDTTNFPNGNAPQYAYNLCLSNNIKYQLLNSIQFTPIYVNISPSLTLTTDGSTQNYIQTQAQSVNIQIEIPKLKAKFIYTDQVSVNISINDELSIISITGLTSNVNQFLKSKIIIFSVPPLKYSEVQATVTIKDSINYPYTKVAPASQFPFLVQKKNIMVNPKKTLQSQFSDNILILTQFGFKIDPQTFIKNRYSTIVCKPNEPFLLKIPLIQNEQKAISQILASLLNILSHKKIIYENIAAKQLEDDKQQLNSQQLANQNSNQINKQQSQIPNNVSVGDNDIYSIAQVLRKKIAKLKGTQRNSQIEKFYLKQNGVLNFQAIQNDIQTYDIKFNLNGTQTSTKAAKEEFEEQNSTLYRILQYSIGRILLNFDPKTKEVYNFLKQYALILSPQLTENNRYKFYLVIDSNEQLDKLGRIFTFPNYSLKFQQFMELIQRLHIVQQSELQNFDLEEEVNKLVKNKIFSIAQLQNVNLHLIELIMQADTSGVYEKPVNVLFPTRGEALHIQTHEIASLVALRYAPSESYLALQKLLGADYKPYGPKGNMQLPSWLELDIQAGLIIMRGAPKLQNVQDVLIRINTNVGYIIREFVLRVEEDQFELQKNNSLKQKERVLKQVRKEKEIPEEIMTLNKCMRQSIFQRSAATGADSPFSKKYKQDEIDEVSEQKKNDNQNKNLKEKQEQDLMKEIEQLCQAPQNWIYSPQYSYIIKSQNQQSEFSKIAVSSQIGLLFISQGDEGILVVDPLQQYNKIAALKTTDNIIGFTITQDAQYVFLSNQQKFTIYNFVNQQNFVQMGQDSEMLFIVDIILNSKEDTAYIFLIDGNVRILDISNKNSPTQIGNLQWQNFQIYSGLLTPDEKFLLVSQDSHGLGIFALSKTPGSVTGTLVGSFPGTTQGYSHRVILTPDLKYLINLDQRNGLSFADFTQITSSNPANYPITFNYYLNQWWPSNLIIPSPYSFALSPDGNFLFLGVRSIGVYTIDITNKNSPNTYMRSYFPFHGNSIVLSPSGNYLYFSNAVSVMVFRRMAPILGLKYVNLYNGIHSIGFDKSNTKYYWRCDYDTARQAYIGAFDTDGLWLIDVSDPTQFQVTTQQYKPPGQSATIDVFYTKNNYQIMMVAINDGVNFMAVLDVSNYASITIIQKVPLGFPFPGYIKDVDNNQSDTLLVCSLDRTIAFVDTTTLGSYFVVATWNFLPFMKGFTTGVMLSTDEKYFIGACRGYGYYVLDVSNLQNIQYINFFDSTGAEQVYKSLLYMQYYLVDGLGGLYIMDQKKLPSFISFSQLTVAVWTNDVTYLRDEKTVIISTLQQGMIHLLDISDVTNPFIVSSFQNGNQNGLFTCVKQDFTTVFINNNVQMRAFPMTVSAYLHADYLQVLGYTPDGDMEFSIINDPDQFNFQVGQTIKINTSYLYQSLDLQVASVTLYQNQIGQALPYWVSYNPVEISLTITIQKEAVDPTNLSKPLLNTFVFTSLLPLYASNFLYTIGSCQTNNIQAKSIFAQLQNQGVINESNLVSPSLHYDDYEQIILTDTTNFPNGSAPQQAYNLCLSNNIKYTLLNSIQFTPIYVNISPSLTLTTDGSTQNYIQTQAQSVNIQIEIPKLKAKFIYTDQVSVNISVNDELNIISITGLTSNVNQFLKSKIIIFPVPPLKYSEVQATVTIKDSINYPYTKVAPASQFPFLVQKKNIMVNPKKTLQSQFSDNILILTQFGFIIDPQTFIVPDFNTTITYKVLVQIGGKFVPFDNTQWLQYNSEGQKFYGNPPQTEFQKSTTVQVSASDGFTKISDTFTVHVNQLPPLFVIQWIATILGPISGVLGAYKFRNVIYNILYKKKNKYSTILCKPNVPFMLKIPLIFNEQKACNQIIVSLLKILAHKKVTYENIAANQLQRLQKCSWQSGVIMISNDFEKQQLTTDNNQMLKQAQINRQKSEIPANIAYKENDIYSVTQSIRKKILSMKGSQKESLIEKFYLKQTGEFNYKIFQQDISQYEINFVLNGVQTSTKILKEEFDDENSTLSTILKLQISKMLMSYDPKSLEVYEFFKKYSLILNPQLHETDWYKYYLNIESTEDLDKQGRIFTFPETKIKFQQFFEPLFKLHLIDQQSIQDYISEEEINALVKKQFYFNIYRQNVNLHLIELVLQADALGIQEKPISSLFPSKGESLHIEAHEIASLIALRYAPGESCLALQKILGADYKPYGPKGNMQLPSWIVLDMQAGIIIMKGTPELQNVEDVLIQINTNVGYIIRQFVLRVEEDQYKLQRAREQSFVKKENSKRGEKRKRNSSGNYDSQVDSQEDLFKNGSPYNEQKNHKPSTFQKSPGMIASNSPFQTKLEQDQVKERIQQDKKDNQKDEQELMKELQQLVL
ncbi:hypothetical protein ABPG72_005462 [Tetrahymena utriculariae]